MCNYPIFFTKMIKLVLGNVGSSKTAQMVLFMKQNTEFNFVTNIDVKPKKDFLHVIKLKPENILLKEIISYKKDGTPNYELKLNIDYWKKLVKTKHNLIVIIDEAHTFFNPRRSMSKINIIMTDFLALLRRILGQNDGNNGQLILITQLSRRLDIIAKEMATDVSFSVFHYEIECLHCGYKKHETNETPHNNKMIKCFNCGKYKVKKTNCFSEVWLFRNINDFSMWYSCQMKTYYSHFLIHNVSSIFGNYDTLQWNDLLSDF
jgi:hypothetical protein